MLRNRIGKQKLILDQLLLLLSSYEESPDIKTLIGELQELQEVYDNIKITYNYDESTTEEENGIIVVKDNTSSSINFAENDLNNILLITTKIRKNIIGE